MCIRDSIRKDMDGTTKGENWWTCQQCLTRWERHPMPDATSEDYLEAPTNTDLVTFGKHMGKTYQQVKDDHPDYVAWMMETLDQETDHSAAFLHLAKYFQKNQVLEFQIQSEDEEMGEYPQEWLEDRNNEL